MTRTTRAALGALALGGLLALTACSAGATGDAPSDESTSSLLPAAEGTTGYPLTLESPWGETELTERPERIAAVTPSQDDVEMLAALGVTPYLASEYATDVWTEEALETPIPERFTTGDVAFPVEQIAAAEPDLIIVLGADASDFYEQLAAIAPVLSTATDEGGEQTVATDWQAGIRAVGEALDLQDAAEQALETETAFFEDFRAEHPEFDGTTAAYLVYYGQEGGLQYHSSSDGPASGVFERMGFAENPNAAEFDYRQLISDELISSVDADVVVFSDNSDGAAAAITEQPLFQALRAVQDDHLVMIENRGAEGEFVIDGVTYPGNLPWALARSGPLSATWAAEQMAPGLAAAIAR